MLCGPPPTVLSPIKRQTFCVQDSPLKQLPPAFQNRILKPQSPKTSVGSRTNCRPAGRPQTTQHPVTSRPTKSVSSPATGAKTQSRMSLRGRSAIGVSVLPSRPTAPKAPQSTNKNPADRSRLQPRSKLSTSWRRSPTSSRNGSCEDLLSDSASVASDVSDCSLNSNSSLGKHAPVPPSKSQGVRTRSGVKPPSDSSRRKTSSSSSSVSSFNSSFSPSPANKGSSSPDASKMMKPKRLMSVRSVDSLPQKTALQLKARRPSALPTPLRSRPSGIPQATPTMPVRPVRAPLTPSAAPKSLTPPESENPESAEIPIIQPFNLEEEESEQRPPTPAKPDQSESSSVPVALCLSQSEANKETEQKQTIETISKMQPEVLLLDLPTPALRPQEKLLIDLRNTPDLIRTKTSAAELIDLSSPLITWSPVEKKETDAPLINLSF
uniref:G2 and S phase-expressed protein 1 N-terminal domain-containing protein n=1 Tax=Neogobius melanostomus TaxID=47308 RepID=A0A8C6S3T4_9GOBI